LADCVFTGACPLHKQGSFYKSLGERAGPVYFLAVVYHHQYTAVEISVTRVRDNGCDKPAPFNVAFGLCDTFGES